MSPRSPARGWLFLESFKRIEDDGLRPLSTEEATRRVLRAFGLDGAVGDSRSAPPSRVPPPPAATIQWQSLIEDYISANNLSEAYDAGHKLIEAGKASFDWSIILAAFAASRLEFQRQWGATLRNALLSGKVAGTDWQGLLEDYVAGGNLSEAYETGRRVIEAGQGAFDWSEILATFAASRLEFQRQWGKTLRDALMKQM